MTENQKTSPQGDVIKKLFDLTEKLTKDQMLQLKLAGWVIPQGLKGGVPGDPSVVYQCRYCGGVALEFVGSKFVDFDGNESDVPDPNTMLRDLPWTQSVAKTPPDRENPTCQHCGAGVYLPYGRIEPKRVKRAGEILSSPPKKGRQSQEVLSGDTVA